MVSKLYFWYAYLRVLVGRGNAHFSVPSMIFTNVSTVSILCKVYGFSGWYIVVFSFLLVALIFVAGYVDLRTRFYETENSVNNSFNKELLMAANKK